MSDSCLSALSALCPLLSPPVRVFSENETDIVCSSVPIQDNYPGRRSTGSTVHCTPRPIANNKKKCSCSLLTGSCCCCCCADCIRNRSFDRMAVSDKVLGLALILASVAIFVYYTIWVLVLVSTIQTMQSRCNDNHLMIFRPVSRSAFRGGTFNPQFISTEDICHRATNDGVSYRTCSHRSIHRISYAERIEEIQMTTSSLFILFNYYLYIVRNKKNG